MKTIVAKIPSRKSLETGQGTLKFGFPWLTFGAIIALEGILKNDMKVLEFGSGGSTIFWANNCQSVKSYETDPKWYESVRQKVKNFKNVDLTLCDKHMSIYLGSEPDNFYDFVLIDNNPKHARRIRLANMAIAKIKRGGWLIVDNYNSFGMRDFDYSKWQVFTFDEFKHRGSGTRLCKKI